MVKYFISQQKLKYYKYYMVVHFSIVHNYYYNMVYCIENEVCTFYVKLSFCKT